MEDTIKPLFLHNTYINKALHALKILAACVLLTITGACQRNNGTDTTPLQISGVTVAAVTATSATITWSTNQAASSQIDYGATTQYGTTTALDTTMVTAHSVTIRGLAPETSYHYRVRSHNSANSEATSSDMNFSTTQAPAQVGELCQPGSGTDYQVGPSSGQLASLDLVPWESLAAGDTVRIFWQATPYKGKFVINSSGTIDKPIRVCGVPNSEGQRPVIDGKDAITRANQTYRPTGEGPSISMENYSLILIDGTSYGSPRPEYIVIDGLDIRGANSSNSFTSTAGEARTYSAGVGCVWIQKGAHITIRNNEVSDCDNGLFTQTQENWDNSTMSPFELTVTRDILIDGNYIHGHGTATGGSTDRFHNSYIQSVGTVYQYNHYGPQRPGAKGSALKDRSIGTVVRYNRIDGGARALDLVEAENNPHMAMLDPAYRTTFVYGNLIRHDNSVGTAIHYGGDHYGGELWTLSNMPWPPSAYGESFFRKGTLYFYNNTVVVDATGYNSSIFQISTTEEHAEIFNNVFWVNGNPSFVGFRSNTDGINPAYWTPGGTINLGVNVFNTGWGINPDNGANHASPGPVTGQANMLTTSTIPVDLVTFRLLPGAVGLNAAQASTFSALAGYPDEWEYTDALVGKPRVQVGSAMDLGALEAAQ